METEVKKTIYDLDLHEELQVSDDVVIQRVASGWNYKYYESRYIEEYQSSEWFLKSVVFVPYDNNFQKVPKTF